MHITYHCEMQRPSSKQSKLKHGASHSFVLERAFWNALVLTASGDEMMTSPFRLPLFEIRCV